jgi:sialidase-1
MKYLFFLVGAVLAGLTAAAQHDIKEPLKSESYIARYGNLDNFFYQVKVKEQANVVFLGGSITNMTGWRDKVCEYLQRTYPATSFRFQNAGIPSLGSLPHAFRFQRDVLSKGRVDLLFVESAVNDQVNGTPAVTQRRALEGIIRHMLSANPAANIVLMAFVDPQKMDRYHDGRVPVEVQVHQDMARHYQLPFINLAKEVTDRIDAGEFTWKDDFKDLHPSPFGQELYFKTIRQLLQAKGNKPVRGQLSRPIILPSPADSFSYTDARYYDVHSAINKKGFTINESWQPEDSIATRPGFVHVPMLVSNGSEASLELPFKGRAVGIGVLAGPDAGHIRYSIDGQPVKEIDLYTEWSSGLYLPWYLLLGDELTEEKHILRIQTGEPHKGLTKNVCRIVYFLVND